MELIGTVLYLTCFAAIAGGAFALMTRSLPSDAPIRRRTKSRHPEAPAPGESVMGVDLNRERLEQLYQRAS